MEAKWDRGRRRRGFPLPCRRGQPVDQEPQRNAGRRDVPVRRDERIRDGGQQGGQAPVRL